MAAPPPSCSAGRAPAADDAGDHRAREGARSIRGEARSSKGAPALPAGAAPPPSCSAGRAPERR
eukprot:1331520-Heterocapsa_arctica.AAC.1